MKGFELASPEITKTTYAAILLALKDEGCDREMCKRVLYKVNELTLHHLDSVDAIDQVFREMKLVLKLKDPLEPIQEVEE